MWMRFWCILRLSFDENISAQIGHFESSFLSCTICLWVSKLLELKNFLLHISHDNLIPSWMLFICLFKFGFQRYFFPQWLQGYFILFFWVCTVLICLSIEFELNLLSHMFRDAAGRPGHGSGRVNQFLLRAGSGRVSKFWNFHGSGRVGSKISKISTGRVGSRVIGFFSRVITGQLKFVAGRHGST